MRIRSILLATAAVLGIGFSPAQAQTYPNRAITLNTDFGTLLHLNLKHFI